VEKLALLFSIRARGCAGIPVKSSTQRVLAAADWHRIGRELTAFAQALLNIHTWRTGNTVDVAGGREGAISFKRPSKRCLDSTRNAENWFHT
jgi:hypothetical protein